MVHRRHLVHVAIARVEAIVYDFGGVLVDVDFARVIARWAALSGADAAALGERFTLGPVYQAHERGEIDASAYFEAMRTELGLALDDAAFADGWNAIFGEPIHPTVEGMHALAGRLPQYLFSNTNAMHHAYWSRRYAAELAPLDAQYVSHEMRLRKPDREAFEHVAAAVGVPAGRILFFDDTVANIEGAKAAGLQSVLVRSTGDVARALAPWLGQSHARA